MRGRRYCIVDHALVPIGNHEGAAGSTRLPILLPYSGVQQPLPGRGQAVALTRTARVRGVGHLDPSGGKCRPQIVIEKGPAMAEAEPLHQRIGRADITGEYNQ